MVIWLFLWPAPAGDPHWLQWCGTVGVLSVPLWADWDLTVEWSCSAWCLEVVYRGGIYTDWVSYLISVCLSVCFSFSLSVCLCLSVCLSVCLSLSLSLSLWSTHSTPLNTNANATMAKEQVWRSKRVAGWSDDCGFCPLLCLQPWRGPGLCFTDASKARELHVYGAKLTCAKWRT